MLNAVDCRPAIALPWASDALAAFRAGLEIPVTVSPCIHIIEFDAGRRAHAVLAQAQASPRRVLAELNLGPLPKGVMTLSGGAQDFPTEMAERTRELLETAIVPLVREKDLLVVDGGTQAGVMQVMGQVLARDRGREHRKSRANRLARPRYNLLGFAPAPQITFPGMLQTGQVLLDPNHSSFVLITDVREWGDEVPSMFKFLDYLAGPKHLPVVSLVVNGGRITIKEVWYAICRGRPVILLEGSGRATDVMVAARDGATQAELAALVKQWNLAHSETEEQEILAWLADIARYDKLKRFLFMSERPQMLKAMLLSALRL